MNPTYDFTGQVAFVTGAGSGMGLAAARAFATSGAAVALADVDETAVHAAAKDLTKAGHQALALVCDVAAPVSSPASRSPSTAATPPSRSVGRPRTPQERAGRTG